MKYKIDDGVLKDIIWEDGDGTTLTIPDGVEVIDTQFRITGRVDTVFLPDSIIEIKAYAFMDSSGNDIEIQNIYYNGTLGEWCAVTKGFHENWGVYVSMGMYGYRLYVRDDIGKYQVVENPKIVDTNIKPICFYGCASLKSVSIYSSKVSEEAFRECRNLKEVSIYGASTEIVDNVFFGGRFCPFDDREDLEIAFSLEAMDKLLEDRECSLLDCDNPLTVIETGDDIREIIETVENIEDVFYEETHLNRDSPVSKIYYTYIKIKTQDEIYDEYDYITEEEDDEPEDPAALVNVEGGFTYESYDDFLNLYDYICGIEKQFLLYKAEMEKVFDNLDKLMEDYEYDIFAYRQLEKLLESIKNNYHIVNECRGKSEDIYRIVSSCINDVLDASDRNSEYTAFNINDIDYHEYLLNPLSAVVFYLEDIEKHIDYICDVLTSSEEIVLEELKTRETDVWRRLDDQKDLLEAFSGEVYGGLNSIPLAFRQLEENLREPVWLS